MDLRKNYVENVWIGRLWGIETQISTALLLTRRTSSFTDSKRHHHHSQPLPLPNSINTKDLIRKSTSTTSHPHQHFTPKPHQHISFKPKQLLTVDFEPTSFNSPLPPPLQLKKSFIDPQPPHNHPPFSPQSILVPPSSSRCLRQLLNQCQSHRSCPLATTLRLPAQCPSTSHHARDHHQAVLFLLLPPSRRSLKIENFLFSL